MTFGEGFPIGQESLEAPVTPVERMERARFEGMRNNLREAMGNLSEVEFAVRLAEALFEKRPDSPAASIILNATKTLETGAGPLEELEQKYSRMKRRLPMSIPDWESPIDVGKRLTAARDAAIAKPVHEIQELFYWLGAAYAWSFMDAKDRAERSGGEEMIVAGYNEFLDEIPPIMFNELKTMPRFKAGAEAYGRVEKDA